MAGLQSLETLKASGAFESTGPREMPKAAVRVSVDVPGFDGSGCPMVREKASADAQEQRAEVTA